MIWPSDRGGRRGFSLLEAMVAMAILALVLGAAMGGVGFTVGQVGQRSDAAWATEMARSVADDYAVTRDPALADGAEGPWRWELSERAAAKGLVEVTVMAWREGGRERAVALSVLLPEGGP